MVAMTPLITIQLLGFKAVAKKTIEKKRKMNKLEKTQNDDVLINF
jgi:hypothetical protein